MSFGMANASMKWNDHITDILKGIESGQEQENKEELANEMAERGLAEEDDEEDD